MILTLRKKRENMDNYKKLIPGLCVVTVFTALNTFLVLSPISMVTATACVCLIVHFVFKGLSSLK